MLLGVQALRAPASAPRGGCAARRRTRVACIAGGAHNRGGVASSKASARCVSVIVFGFGGGGGTWGGGEPVRWAPAPEHASSPPQRQRQRQRQRSGASDGGGGRGGGGGQLRLGAAPRLSAKARTTEEAAHHRQRLTLVHFSAQLEPCLPHKNNLHP